MGNPGIHFYKHVYKRKIRFDIMEIMIRDVSEDVFLDELDDDEYKRRTDAFMEAVKKHRTI